MMTIHDAIEIQELLEELNGWVEYDPGGELDLRVEVAHDKLQQYIKLLEKHRS